MKTYPNTETNEYTIRYADTVLTTTFVGHELTQQQQEELANQPVVEKKQRVVKVKVLTEE